MWELRDERIDRHTLLIIIVPHLTRPVGALHRETEDDDLFCQLDGGHFRLYDPAASFDFGPTSGAPPSVAVDFNGRIHETFSDN